jgi:hypothetical protein
VNGAPPPSPVLNRRVTRVAVVAATVLLGVELCLPPIMGLANEGDFEGVTGNAGLRYLTDNTTKSAGAMS